MEPWGCCYLRLPAICTTPYNPFAGNGPGSRPPGPFLFLGQAAGGVPSVDIGCSARRKNFRTTVRFEMKEAAN